MKFIHISDLHFHQDPNNNTDAVATLDYLRVHYPQHNLIITGDIADDGHEEQFHQAFKALELFMDGNRIFICPGNHDFGAAGNLYSRERAERFDQLLSIPLKQGGTFTGDQTPVVNLLREDDLKIMLIALDTNLETEHAFDFACGEVGERQLRFLETILSDHFSQAFKKILFFHHHLFIHNSPYMELTDGDQLMRTIYNRVDVVLFGHKHEMGFWKNACGIPFILASDNSPGKDFVREIVITPDQPIAVNDIAII